MYALNSKESKRQYPKRLQRFLDFINISSGSIEDNCNLLYEKLKKKKTIFHGLKMNYSNFSHYRIIELKEEKYLQKPSKTILNLLKDSAK